MTLFRNQKNDISQKLWHVSQRYVTPRAQREEKNAKSAVFAIFLCTPTLRFYSSLGVLKIVPATPIVSQKRHKSLCDMCHKKRHKSLCDMCHKNNTSRGVWHVSQKTTQVALWHVSQKRHKSLCVTCVTKTTQVALWHVSFAQMLKKCQKRKVGVHRK